MNATPGTEAAQGTPLDQDPAAWAAALGGFWEGLKPDPYMTVSQWADEHRVLAARAGSEGGRWRTSRTPYLREPMDSLSARSGVERVVMMFGSQLGKTETGNNWIGYVIDHAPAPMLAVSPTDKMASRNAAQRIDPLIEESPRLRLKVATRKSRDAGNTAEQKLFPGGIIVLTGANSPIGLRSMPARYLFLDEVDAYPRNVGNEGDPVELARARQVSFGVRAKELMTSTPKDKGMSIIEDGWLESDQRRYFVPCPHCGQMQTLEFDNLKLARVTPQGLDLLPRFGDAPRVLDQTFRAVMVCTVSGCIVEEHHKTTMLERGEWRVTCPENVRPDVRGYQLSSLYSPLGWFSWKRIIEKWRRAKGNVTRLKTFYNTVLGLPFQETGDAPDWEVLYRRRERYKPGTAPRGVCLITAGVDVQGDRMEAEVVGWGPGMESWSLDYVTLPGDPYKLEVWGLFAAFLDRTYPRADGVELPIRLAAVDTGFATQEVRFRLRRFQGRALAVMGRDGQHVLVGSAITTDLNRAGRQWRRGARYFPVGVGIAKSQIYGWLRLDPPLNPRSQPFPPGYCHFPPYGEDFFKQLTAEHLVPHEVRGYPKAQWEKIPGRRNEALDCRVYARAAAAILGADRFKKEHWARAADTIAASQRAAPATRAPQERSGSHWDGWE